MLKNIEKLLKKFRELPEAGEVSNRFYDIKSSNKKKNMTFTMGVNNMERI